jgi:hypothetical protein
MAIVVRSSKMHAQFTLRVLAFFRDHDVVMDRRDHATPLTPVTRFGGAHDTFLTVAAP